MKLVYLVAIGVLFSCANAKTQKEKLLGSWEAITEIKDKNIFYEIQTYLSTDSVGFETTFYSRTTKLKAGYKSKGDTLFFSFSNGDKQRWKIIKLNATELQLQYVTYNGSTEPIKVYKRINN